MSAAAQQVDEQGHDGCTYQGRRTLVGCSPAGGKLDALGHHLCANVRRERQRALDDLADHGAVRGPQPASELDVDEVDVSYQLGTGSSSIRLDTAALLAIATATDAKISERTLEFWRHEGLLPHADRTGQKGIRAVWTYPAETADQLRSLLRLRAATRDPNVLRAALWFEGYPLTTSRLRTSITGFLRSMQTALDKELAKLSSAASREDHALGRWQAITELAHTVAAARSRRTPRAGRQRLADRTRAFALLFGLALDEPAAVDQLDSDAAALERALGTDRGRRFRPNSVEPWLTGAPSESWALFREVGSLPRLIEIAESATDAELEAARPLAQTLLFGISAFSQMTDALAGDRNAAGLAAFVAVSDDPVARALLPVFVISLMRSPALVDNLAAISSALTDSVLPLQAAVRELATLPPDQRAARLKHLDRLSWTQQNQLKRLIEAFERPLNEGPAAIERGDEPGELDDGDLA
jgi:DNA-binding transcriptional MerR regulator